MTNLSDYYRDDLEQCGHFSSEKKSCEIKHERTFNVSSSLLGLKPHLKLASGLKIVRKIGHGKNSQVYYGLLRQTSKEEVEEVAVKECYGSFEKLEKILEENAKCMLNLNHENVVRFRGLYSRVDKASLFLTQFGKGGTLKEFLVKQKIPIEIIVKWSKQIVEGMLYLHAQNVVHRDLKAENVVLSSCEMSECVLKIIDVNDAETFGTPSHMSPEAMNFKISKKSDSWSFGVTLWEMVCRKRPFEELESSAQVLFKVAIKRETLKIPDTHPVLQNIMRDCWRFDEEERCGFDEIQQKLAEFKCEVQFTDMDLFSYVNNAQIPTFLNAF